MFLSVALELGGVECDGDGVGIGALRHVWLRRAAYRSDAEIDVLIRADPGRKRVWRTRRHEHRSCRRRAEGTDKRCGLEPEVVIEDARAVARPKGRATIDALGTERDAGTIRAVVGDVLVARVRPRVLDGVVRERQRAGNVEVDRTVADHPARYRKVPGGAEILPGMISCHGP